MIEPKYDYSSQYFYEGLAFVGIDKVKTAVIDPDGNIVIPPRKIEGGLKFSEGLAWVRIDGEGWYIDREGNSLLSTADGCGYAFLEGLARIMFTDPYNRSKSSSGYMNKNGYYITHRLYDVAGGFIEGLAYVALNGKHGYLNRYGEEAIALRFDGAKTFSEGLAPVKLKDKWGYINHKEEFVIEPRFDDAWPFENGLACFENRNSYGFINREGEVVIKPLFRYLDHHSFYGDLFPVPFRDSKGLRKQYSLVLDGHEWKNGAYGYIDREGNITILPRFNYANPFFFGLASVRTTNKRVRGYINSSGEFAISERFYSAGYFHDIFSSPE